MRCAVAVQAVVDGANHRQLCAPGDQRSIEVGFASRLCRDGGLLREIGEPRGPEQDDKKKPRQRVPEPHDSLATNAQRQGGGRTRSMAR